MQQIIMTREDTEAYKGTEDVQIAVKYATAALMRAKFTGDGVRVWTADNVLVATFHPL